MENMDDMGFKAEDAGEIENVPSALISEVNYGGIDPRGLTAATCKKFHYGTGRDHKGTQCHIANEYDRKGKLVAQKLRYRDKTFAWLGKAKQADPLWGMSVWGTSHNSKGTHKSMVVITEGEIDCMTVSQLQDNRWPVVSLANGAQTAGKAVVEALEWLDRFDKIILMFDMDEPGRAAVEEAAAKLPVGKAFVAKLGLKDANEMVMAGRGQEVITAIWEAEPWRPDRVLGGTDLINSVMDYEEPEGLPWPWEGARAMMPVMQVPSITLLLAGTGGGKTTICRALEHYILTSGEKLGIIHLEEPPKKTALSLVGYELKRKLNFGTNGLSRDELAEAAKRILSDRVYLYDGFGSIALDIIVARIRYMAGSGCRYIVLDHLSILASGAEGDERKALDIAMTRLRTLCEELNICILLVCHLKRGTQAEEGGEIDLEDIRGSHGIPQLADFVLSFRRNRKAEGWKRNLTLVSCLKNREWGLEGPMFCLVYGDDGHFKELPVAVWEEEDVVDDSEEFKQAAEVNGETPL